MNFSIIGNARFWLLRLEEEGNFRRGVIEFTEVKGIEWINAYIRCWHSYAVIRMLWMHD